MTRTRYGHLEVVELLLEQKIDLNIRVHAPDEAGMSPIYVAAKNGHVDVVRFLIKVNSSILIISLFLLFYYLIFVIFLSKSYFLFFRFLFLLLSFVIYPLFLHFYIKNRLKI